MPDSTTPPERDFSKVDFVDDYPILGDEVGDALNQVRIGTPPPSVAMPPRWPPEDLG